MLTQSEANGIAPLMPGEVLPKQKNCPYCKVPFNLAQDGYPCPTCGQFPKRYKIYIPSQFTTQGPARIYSEPDGTVLDGWSRAVRLLNILSAEIETSKNHKIDLTKYIPSKKIPFIFSRFCDTWLKSKRDNAPSYFYVLESYSKNHFIPHFQDKDMRYITNYDIEVFSQTLSYCSPKYRSNVLNALHNLFQCAYAWHGIPEPLFPKNKMKPPQKRMRVAEISLQNLIYQKIPDQHKPIFYFYFQHAVRPAEAMALRVNNVNLEQGTATICETFSRYIHRKITKGKKDKVIPLQPEMVTMLKKIMPKDGFVFQIRPGEPYIRMDEIYRNARKDITDLNLYEIGRHTRINWFVEQGNNIRDIKEFVGHSDIRQTEKYFGGVAVEKLRLMLVQNKEDDRKGNNQHKKRLP